MNATDSSTIRDQESSTTRRVADRAHEAVDTVAEHAEQVEEQVRERAEKAQHQVRDAANRVSRESGAALDSITGYVRGHPMQAVGIAFAAGVVTSMLLRR